MYTKFTYVDNMFIAYQTRMFEDLDATTVDADMPMSAHSWHNLGSRSRTNVTSALTFCTQWLNIELILGEILYISLVDVPLKKYHEDYRSCSSMHVRTDCHRASQS